MSLRPAVLPQAQSNLAIGAVTGGVRGRLTTGLTLCALASALLSQQTVWQ